MIGLAESIGVDLGTSNTLVCAKGRGIIIREPSVVAVFEEELVALGEEAGTMLGRAADGIAVVRPVQDGVIADFTATCVLLRYLLTRVCGRPRLFKPRICISIPSGATAVEKRAFVEAARAGGAGSALPVEGPLAAAIGAGLDVSSPKGHLVVDIGGGTTDAAVISMAGIVLSESIRLGGSDMDELIVRHMKQTHNLDIGERTAEDIKIRIGSAYPLPNESSLTVRGRDIVSGLPRAVEMSSEEVREALTEPVAAIVECVRRVLQNTPPELAADIMELGITLAGGGALLRGLDQLLAEQTELSVQVTEDPLASVAVGTGLYLEMAPGLPPALLATATEASSGYSR